MYCNNGADRTIVKQNHGPGAYLGGAYLGQGPGTLSDKSDKSDEIGQVGRPQPQRTQLVRRPTRPTRPTCPIKALPQRHSRQAPPQRHPRKGTPAPPSWLPHIMDNELLLKGGEAPFAGVPIDRL